MSIELDDKLSFNLDFTNNGTDEIFINIDFKPYLNNEDMDLFYRLGINKIAFYEYWSDDYIINNNPYSINPNSDEFWNYKSYKFTLNSVFLRSLNIRFMKINKREGNVMCDDPWRRLL